MDFYKHFEDIKLDLWQHLKNSDKPVVLYGMGDGADKICAVLESMDIPLSGVFASDGFVREKLFHGHRIESFSSVTERLNDPIVLVSFGTKKEDVLENIFRIASTVELYAPDVPVFGGGLLTLEHFRKNADRFARVYDALADEISKKAYINSLKYRLSGKIDYLFDCETDVEESYNTILKPPAECVYVDIGAYNGDTVEEFSAHSGKNIAVHAFEPDTRNFKKLLSYGESCGIKELHLHNMAAWDKKEQLTFFSRSGRNSANTTSHANAKATSINAVNIDSVVERADFIKIDAEGADIEAIVGATRLISSQKPTMCIAAYHRTDDYFEIPEKVLWICPDYDIYFRHFRHIPCWDTNFYFRKKAHS